MPDIVNTVCAVAARTHLELVLVNEIHNISLASRAGAEVSDQLKYFAERLPATVAHAGIEVEEAGLFAGLRGRQTAGHSPCLPPPPSTTAHRAAHHLAGAGPLEQALRLHEHRPGTLVEHADYLYERITTELLELIPLDHAAPAAPRPAATPRAARRSADGLPAADHDPARSPRDRRLLIRRPTHAGLPK